MVHVNSMNQMYQIEPVCPMCGRLITICITRSADNILSGSENILIFETLTLSGLQDATSSETTMTDSVRRRLDTSVGKFHLHISSQRSYLLLFSSQRSYLLHFSSQRSYFGTSFFSLFFFKDCSTELLHPFLATSLKILILHLFNNLKITRQNEFIFDLYLYP